MAEARCSVPSRPEAAGVERVVRTRASAVVVAVDSQVRWARRQDLRTVRPLGELRLRRPPRARLGAQATWGERLVAAARTAASTLAWRVAERSAVALAVGEAATFRLRTPERTGLLAAETAPTPLRLALPEERLERHPLREATGPLRSAPTAVRVVAVV